ncbi:MAG: RagB/SusD family nutrient uptake outer membrane protein [Bacteroidales bacterium]
MKNLKNISKIIIFSAALFISISSCTDLTEVPYSDLSDENFLNTEEEISAAIGEAYAQLRNFQDFGNMWAVYCTADEVAIVGRTGGDWAGDGQDQQMTDQTWISNNRFFTGTWYSFYGGINTANRIIHQLEQIDSNVYQNSIAELRTIRALWYLWLIDMWGNVPIVNEFDVSQDYLPATSSRQEVYSFIENEILDSQADLSRDNDISTYGKANYWTAKAILAKLYLNAEVYTGTPQWQKALDVTNEIIDSGRFSMTNTYKENFVSHNENSTEAIFSIPFDEIYTQWEWFLPLVTLHYSSQATFNMTMQPWNGLSVQTDFFALYDDEDVRKKANFLWGPQYTTTGEPLIDPGYEQDPAIDGDPHINFTPEFQSLYLTSRQSGARIIKWEIEVGSSGHLNSDFFVFRYTDILLMKAEILWRMNPSSSEALEIINRIRDRAQVESFNSLSVDKLLDERGRELLMEGWRRSDLIRYNQYGEPTIFKPQGSEEFRELFPIPQDVIGANPNLLQNTGY